MKLPLVSLYVGGAGVGKTYSACTYPKIYMISTEPNHHWVWELNPELKKNIVKQEYFIPDVGEEESFRTYFQRINKAIAEAKEMQVKGEVETLVLDNGTYFFHNRWLWQNKFASITNKQGEVDTRGMYGQLRTWAYEFTLMRLLSFKGNIVLTLHEMRESEEAMDKKLDKSIEKVPNLLGGFRNDIAGLFSNVFYLSKVHKGEDDYQYKARTNKGNSADAKNRFGLKEVIDNMSYSKLMEHVKKSVGEGK